MHVYIRLYLKYILLSYLLSIFVIESNKILVLAMTTPAQEDLKKVILIDPGHGGIDGGTVSRRGTLEKDINLSISLKLRDKLNEYGYIVLMTREEDKGLYNSTTSAAKMKYEDLNNRCNMKRDSNCDLFISIHQNDFPQPDYFGAQTWYSKSRKSKLLGQIIQNNLKKDINNNNKREEKSAGDSYKILRCHLNIPSVIVECGFLSNSREDNLLRNEAYQLTIATSIANSVKEFFQEDDSSTFISRLLKHRQK